MILETEGLEFSYDDEIRVLNDIDLELKKGEIMAVIGPNGSGKSTLLKCLDNILESQRGRVLVDGVDIDEYDLGELPKKIGYVPQVEEKGFLSTVLDTVLMGRKPYISWKPSDKDLRITEEIIEELGIKSIAMRDIHNLSGGQRQKVFIARAVAQQPDILLLDEPTSSLDLKHQLEVLNIIKEQTEEGIGVIMAIHDLNMAVRYSDRIVMLKDGEIYESGDREIITPERIERVYDVKVHVGEHEGWMIVIPEEPVSSLQDQ